MSLVLAKTQPLFVDEAVQATAPAKSALHNNDAAENSIGDRVAACDWSVHIADLQLKGNTILRKLLSEQECTALAALYPEAALFRSRVLMQRHGFGRGEYQYFDYPLPPLVGGLRSALYAQLAPLANQWHATMGFATRFAPQHADFLAQCHAAGQLRSTPLLLQYQPGDYNCLHQDVYGDWVFPLQVVILLSAPERDFTGGELVLTEQRPRMQSRAEVVPLAQGDAVVFAVRQRPVQGTRGSYRVNQRHGVSTVHSGQRHTLGVIFHDAL